MEIRFDRLEECYRANVGRKHICMGSWDSCLIGGYSQSLLSLIRITESSVVFKGDALAFYDWLGEHFGISGYEANRIFSGIDVVDGYPKARSGESALARLRAFIDAHKPAIPTTDFKEPHALADARLVLDSI